MLVILCAVKSPTITRSRQEAAITDLGGILLERYQYSDEELAFMEESQVPFAIYQFVNKRVVTLALSKGFFELFGLTGMDKKEVYDLMDNNMYRETHPDDLAALGDAAYRFATEDEPYDVVYRSRKDGEYRIIHAHGTHLVKKDGTRVACVWYTDQGAYIEDERNEKDSILNSLKNQLSARSLSTKVGHDYLTGLPSMTYFFELAEEGCRQIRGSGKTPAIIFADFNGMKVYNQKFGLEGGDKYLKAFSDEIISIFSHENCSRFSADHFCIFTDVDTALSGAEKLIEANDRTDSENKMPLRIGIFTYDDDTISISGACDRAKIACDSGRKNYKGQIYLFDNKMMTTIEDRQYVVENIDKAIKEGWIKVYYQAIVRTVNGRVCAEEALSRWVDPVKGFLSPADFIPALEESNSIYKLDLFVVDKVLEKMKEQAEHGLYVVPMSVNFSRSDFYTCDIVEEIKRRIDDAGIPRDKLVIEITESAIADDVDYMIEKIKDFKDLGFTVWMDDYGSGYSSPIILQKVPFDLIKIDMLFVRQLDEGDKARIILTEIVRMAMALGLDTIAEGIETKEQADFLKDIGCTMLQGYYFTKPIPFAEILDRNKKGIQIGFENPKESGYYAHLGRVNIYNLSAARTDDMLLKNYFDTWPMVMLECKDDTISLVKSNVTFKNFVATNFPGAMDIEVFKASEHLGRQGDTSLKAFLQCVKDGKRVFVEDRTIDKRVFRLLMWRVAVNPVTGVAAVMIAILSFKEDYNLTDEGIL
jgi:diguanylate cyclase (GGDEF)-like protein